MSTVAPPLNLAQLNARLEEASRDFGVPTARVPRMLCTLIVSQLLPEAVAVKGGMGVKLRMGERGTRATADLDVSTPRRAFHRGPETTAGARSGAHSTSIRHAPIQSDGVLPWQGLGCPGRGVSDPETEPHAHARRDVDDELVALCERFGFGKLRPVELIDLDHQIAQKIHAVTDPDCARAHDLVDLQLLWDAGPELQSVRESCVRTFAFRRAIGSLR